MGNLRLGIDVGSTTAKIVVFNGKDVLYSRYERHNARQRETVLKLLEEAKAVFPRVKFIAAVCGSGGRDIARMLGVRYIQEVVANSAAVCEMYPDARCAVELGGQDAKVIFFRYDNNKNRLQTSDMRMNGSCAGGTGAFIDEIAKLLNTDTEHFDSLAENGDTVYDISGRCGVFAKTDIQPLLISGAKKEDIALSALHSIAKQTIGGLAQGLELEPPIIFEGGPLTFNKTLIRVFAEKLNLRNDDIIIPPHPETIVAYGTALFADRLYPKGDGGATLDELVKRLSENNETQEVSHESPFFSSEEEKRSFIARHSAELHDIAAPHPENGVLKIYIGIDSGSTTSKIVFTDETGTVVDRFYANNNGEPLAVVRDGLNELNKKYDDMGVRLDVLGLGTTGYGERMLSSAFGADCHVVETVAHSAACTAFYPETTFLLDIGGQDMKAIWLKDGIITDIMMNEACSSGCGSFLENFAHSLEIPVDEIADAAFRSKSPAKLGSRCTVFMNSTIINEQRNGKNPDDIMAGLCRSIIENVFTKVVRISDTSRLGDHIAVQGGTFKNLAVLRAIEEYLGKEVALAPYPGEMGAVGAALLAKENAEKIGAHSTKFIGFENISDFTYTTETGVKCGGCANGCLRTVTRFSTGGKWIAGNRCERGLALNEESPHGTARRAADLFEEREQMLFADYPYEPVCEPKNITVGLPRTLEFWESMPFWNTFFKALGYNVRFSCKSARKMYERGLKYVASDTICFPAKLAHGHIDDLMRSGVDRIFMPYIMHMPPEGVDKLSPYVCSVIMGYPMVIRNSQNPERDGAVFDTPVFHWFTEKNRKQQICEYAKSTLNASDSEAKHAFEQAENALLSFRSKLRKRGDEIIAETHKSGGCAVVLAGRPYHTDSFVCHDISKRFTERGMPVLTLDSLPRLNEQDLKNTTIEITNNFHTRMLEGAMIAAKDSSLEYVQIVSFGCGHDAVLSDEIIRVLNEAGDKSPLILKVDESDAACSLGIRIQSFIKTIEIKRRGGSVYNIKELGDPSPAKFRKADKKKRTLIIPNISREVSVLLDAVLEKRGFRVKTVPVGGTEEIKLGKKYVHNDICFPCQMVIGELIGELIRGGYNQDDVAVGMVKFQCDCRMSHYAGLLRKGLDRAGFDKVPIITTDVNDTKNMHPGVLLLGIGSVLDAVWVFMMLDVLTELCCKIRPYEINKGETDKVYAECVDMLADGIKRGISSAQKAFAVCIDKANKIPYDRRCQKPRVFVTGELLVTYHPGSNFNIEKYLEANGMETVFPRITDQLRKDFRATECEISDFNANIFPYPRMVEALFDYVQSRVEKIASKHKLFSSAPKPAEMYKGVSDIIPETLSCGEGWLMAAEIEHYAKKGVKSFIILQPFGCLPNHVCGRGIIKKLKQRHPDISVLPLDLDPDTSYANVENRLQMLIMNTEKILRKDDGIQIKINIF